jgi:hypothetical protein
VGGCALSRRRGSDTDERLRQTVDRCIDVGELVTDGQRTSLLFYFLFKVLGLKKVDVVVILFED